MSSRLSIGVGLVGSGFLTVGGYGVGAPPSAAAVPLALPLCVAGVLLLIVAWWFLREGTARAVLWAAGLWSVPLLAAPPLFSRDLYAYAGQAQVLLRGLDPYESGPSAVPGPLADEVDEVWADVPSPYGPVFLRLAAGVVGLTGERPLAAAIGLRLLAVLGIALLAWGLKRIAPTYGVRPGRAIWLGVANPLVLLHGVAGGHNDLLMLGLLVAGLSLVPRSLPLAAAVVTVGVLVKAPAVAGLVFLPLLAAGSRLRSAVVTLATAAATAVLLTAASGLGWGWFGTLDSGNARRSLLSVTTGVGVLVGQVGAAQVAGLAAAACIGLVLLIRAGRLGPVRALGLALLAAAMLGPIVQPWYLLWGTCLLAAVAGGRAAVALAVGCAIACLLILPSGRHVIRPPLYGVPMLLVAAAASATYARAGRVQP